MMVITVMMLAIAARPDTRGEGSVSGYSWHAGGRRQPLVSFNEIKNVLSRLGGRRNDMPTSPSPSDLIKAHLYSL